MFIQINLLGIPGFIGGVCGGIAAAVADRESYGSLLKTLFPMIESEARTSINQGGYQILCLFVTMGIAILSGSFSAIMVKIFINSDHAYFQDIFFWEGAEGYIPVKQEVKEDLEQEFENKIAKQGATTRHHKGTVIFHPEHLPSMLKQIQNLDHANFDNDPYIKSLPEKEKKEAIKNIRAFAQKANSVITPEKLENLPFMKDRDDDIKFKKMEVNSGKNKKNKDHKDKVSVESPYRKIENKDL